MKPIRGEHRRKVVHDPWGRQEEPVAHEDTAHAVSPDGALESSSVERQFALGCGCLGKPPAGFCSVCDRILPVCSDCFHHCANDGCGRPLCRRHAISVEGSGGTHLHMCQRCFEATARKRLLGRVGRTLLSPFVQFGHNDE